LKPNERLYKKLNTTTLIAVYLLILVGGIVRSTGAGMGCPDWPKCFGEYIPPIDESELPKDYQEVYAQKRIDKNKRVSSMLFALGFDRMANKVANDASVKDEQPFNVTKTWIEYRNRLLGVLIGFFILLCFVSSITFWKYKKSIFYLSLLALILVIFQGWIGSIVVSTNLLPGMITVHMVLAIALIAVLIYIRFLVNRDNIKGVVSYKPYKVKRLVVLSIILFLAQVVLGTQVREAVDMVANRLGETGRWEWIENLGFTFYIHRSYSLLILFIHVLLVYRLTKSVENFSGSKILIWSLLGLVIFEILTGMSLAYFALPYFIQPVHLLLAIMIFGAQYYLYLIICEKTKVETVDAA
jgi:cytochrome c oxidase assembly protein subunit 15